MKHEEELAPTYASVKSLGVILKTLDVTLFSELVRKVYDEKKTLHK